MSVAKIFKILIIVVACVIIGALVLNVLLPNTTRALVNAVEDNIFRATGMTFDLNGDGIQGSNTNNDYTGGNTGSQQTNGSDETDSGEVDGWN